MVPYLTDEVPTVGNGGVSEDLTSITWKLQAGLLWSDGSPVTSADLVFTAQYCMDPEGGCAQLAKFDGVTSVEAIDELTAKVTFDQPKPNPYGPFVGASLRLSKRHNSLIAWAHAHQNVQKPTLAQSALARLL